MYAGQIPEFESVSSTPTSSSQSSIDQDEVNRRIAPDWSHCHRLLQSSGFRLDTYRDVKEYYERLPWFQSYSQSTADDFLCEYSRICRGYDEDALFKDAGLPDNLFRGYRACDKKRVVVKCVHLLSREYDIIYHLSTSPLQHDPMNHCIPVLDLIGVPQDGIALIVMEEWSPLLNLAASPPTLSSFLSLTRQCIEHIAFMHKHRIAHLDISMHNFLINEGSRCACIDFESSHRFHADRNSRMSGGRRGTEVPPEMDCHQDVDPYKVDIWALGVLLLRMSKLAGYCIPRLLNLAQSMLVDDPDRRPSSEAVLKIFQNIVVEIEAP